MSTRVCSNCGSPCDYDNRGGSVDHYLVCSCGSPKYRVPGEYGGSRDDTYDGNVFNARPVTVDEFRKLRNPAPQPTSPQRPRRWDREDD